MPEMIHYTVTETRSVQVTANTHEEAARIAAVAFEHGQDSNGGVKGSRETLELLVGVWGNTDSHIKKESLLVERNH